MSYIYVRNERIIMDAYDLITSGAQIRKLITKYVEPIRGRFRIASRLIISVLASAMVGKLRDNSCK